MWKNGNIHERVKFLRKELDEVQYVLDRDPKNMELREEECAILKTFNNATLDEELFLKQKAKVAWLN